jgi:hypothetical protein
MAFLGLISRRNKAGTGADAAVDAALKKRLSDRLHAVQDARRLGEAPTVAADCRANRRERVYRVGSAMFGPDHETSCRIVDQSYAGMRLEIHGDKACPDEFALTIPTLRFIGVVRKAWQNETEIGVSIVRWSDAA